MKALPFIDAQGLRSALGMLDAIDALERAFKGELPVAPDRTHLDVGNGDLLLMPAWSESSMGVKLVTVAPGNAVLGKPLIQGVYVLFEKSTLSPIAMYDAAPLTALRTAAVSGLATRYLAQPDAEKLVIFGAGAQARAHLEAMLAVRDIRQVKVASRTHASAEELVTLATELGIEASTATANAVADADIICTCTTSSTPLFDGALLGLEVHINAVGSYKPSARELDDATLRGCSRVVVDTFVALSESGDLCEPLEDGVVVREDIEDLAGVVGARRPGEGISARTVFKSVGSAFEDLIVAEAAYRKLAGLTE